MADVVAVQRFRLGEWTVEPDLNRLTRGESSVQLEPKAMDVLVFLAQHPSEVLSHEAIIDGVWAEEFVGEGVLRRAITVLREALGDDARNPSYIETISKRGYRLIAEVAWAHPVPPTADEAEGKGFRPRWTHALAVVAAVVIALLVVLPPEGIWQRITNEERAEPERPPRIVVLPFENLGPPEDEYFAESVSEEITARLAAVRGLGVIGRTSALRYKGRGTSIAQIGADLDVDYILEGSVRWQKMTDGRSRIRVTPQLIQVADETHIWAHVYEQDLSDIFEVQARIASQVISQLRAELLEAEERAVEERPTENMEAYQAYLAGRRYKGTLNPEDIPRALRLFERAVELDPRFAAAHALVSVQHTLAYFAGIDRTEDRRSRALRSAERALELAPDLPEGHWALGMYYDHCLFDLDRALQHYEIAAALRPNDPDVLFGMALALERLGRWSEALATLERSVEIDPQNPLNVGMLAAMLGLQRRYPEAAETIDRAIAIAPDVVDSYGFKHDIYLSWYGPSAESRQVLEEMPDWVPWREARWLMQELLGGEYAAALERLARSPEPAVWWGPDSLWECLCHFYLREPERAAERCDAAREALLQAVAERPSASAPHIGLAWAYVGLGRREEAIREAKEAAALATTTAGTRDRRAVLEQLAAIYAAIGEPDEALDRIDSLLSIPGKLSAARLRLEPRWDPLRDHPRFAKILEKYGQEE